ncbi:MAG TPA: site-specific integrase [Urbifossiella sp.]|jgi:integrase|nr:site-specific integrase [Urbifossiella sp.]
MGRHAKHVITVADGRQVGYAPKARAGFFRVQFKHPSEPGKYVEVATGVAVPKGWSSKKNPPPAWFAEAEKAIKEAYAPTAMAGLGVMGNATWEEAEKYLMEDITRDGSARTYRSALSVIRAGLPGLHGPADVTADHAMRFAKKYASGSYRRSKAATAVSRPRKAQTVWSTLNNLSVMWGRFKKLKLVSENVWAEVERPRVPKKLPRTPSEESLGTLFRWLDQRFPGPDGTGWELIKTFLRVKMVAGCRLKDLCRVESSQLDSKAGTLLITADQDKTHQERLITLPPVLVEALNRLKGDRYLWERYSVDSAVHRAAKRRAKEFTPKVLYNAIQSIFREYGKANPADKVKTHDLRKRAITLTVMAMNGDIEAAAQAIPVTSDTARRHYLDTKRAYNAADIQRKTAGVLLGNLGPDEPKKAVEELDQSG